MENYEKKYKNALEWARQVMSGKIGFIRKDVEDVFPELAESEDERIRKGIMLLVKDWWDRVDNNELPPKDKMLAWLERQGEQKPTKEQRDLLFQKMKEAGYEWDSEKKELSKCVIDESKSEMDYCFTKMMNGEKVSPAWSEEDERTLEGIIDEIEANKNHAPDYDLATYDRFLSWLKSIKERIGEKL